MGIRFFGRFILIRYLRTHDIIPTAAQPVTMQSSPVTKAATVP